MLVKWVLGHFLYRQSIVHYRQLVRHSSFELERTSAWKFIASSQVNYNGVCHSGGHYWNHYPGALPLFKFSHCKSFKRSIDLGVGTHRWNLQVPNLEINGSDLTKGMGTSFVMPVTATRATCPIESCYNMVQYNMILHTAQQWRRYNKDQEPFHEWFSHRNSNLMEISFCSDPSYSIVLTMKFCTWHDSCTAVACAKFCSDMIP